MFVLLVVVLAGIAGEMIGARNSIRLEWAEADAKTARAEKSEAAQGSMHE
jgi:hypothetical protein